MAKIKINGELFDFDRDHKPMSEALALEKALGCPYGQWEDDLGKGSVRAMAGFIWLVWRRDGRDIKLEDILSGAVDVDLGTLEMELDGGEEPGPTTPTPTASSTTGASTSGRSRKS